MGIVRKQSIIGFAYTYIGAALGFITSGLLFPKLLSAQEIGLISLLVTYSTLFAQLASAGFLNTTTKMFPYFRDESKQHNGFLFLALTVVSIGSILMVATYFLIKPLILSNSNGGLFAEYAWLIVPLFVFIVFFNILDSYSKSLFNATRGIFLKELFLRFLILAILVFYAVNFINFGDFVLAYILSYGAIMTLIALRLIHDKQFNLRMQKTLLTRPMVKELGAVSLNGLVITAASFIVVNIDRIMIEKLVEVDSLAQVGIYTTCTFFATMIILPSRPLLNISSAIISEAWKAKDKLKLQEVYTKTTITQFIIGLLVFIGLIINLDYIFYIIPRTYESGKWVIVFIGLFYLSDMLLGAGKSIISNSKNYKMLSVFTVILIILIIILNIIFIPKYGIIGAAFSSFIAKLIYNVIVFLYTFFKFKLQPYSYKHIVILVVGALSLFVASLVPETSNLYANIVLKSGIITIIYAVGIYFTKTSEDVNEIVAKVLNRIRE